MLRWFESSTRHVTTITETEIIPVIVDRSPELRRGIPAVQPPGKYSETVNIPEHCVRGDGAKCVVAEAIKTLFPDMEPHIEGEHPYIIDSTGRRIKITLDENTVAAIGQFDRGEPDAFTGRNIIITWD